METDQRFETPDGALIYGTLRQAAGGPARRLVLHLHGLTHSHQSYLSLLSADYFADRGYDHLRFSFYGPYDRARRLPETDLHTHVADLETVYRQVRSRYDEVYLTGHSLGGLTALIANLPDLAAMSLWDPSCDVTHFWTAVNCLTPLPDGRRYELDYGSVFLIGAGLVEDLKAWPDEACLRQARSIVTPTQFVIPEESLFLFSPHTSPERYREAFAGPFVLSSVPGADHVFVQEGKAAALFEATGRWFESPSRGEREEAMKGRGG